MKSNKYGITLVELIVTVCVLFILVGAVTVGWGYIDRSNREFDRQMAQNYQNALKIYVTNAIKNKNSVYLDNAQLVANAISSVVGQSPLDFKCKTNNYKMYYNVSTMEVIASEYPPGTDFRFLPTGYADGTKP